MRVEGSHRDRGSQFSLAVYLVPTWAYGGYATPLEPPRGRKIFKLDMHAPLYTPDEREQQKVLGFGAAA